MYRVFINLNIYLSALVFFLTTSLVLADYNVECEGHDSYTLASVHGECNDGNFEGYDSETDEYVYGDCELGGDLEAYNSETNEYVSGKCEDE